MLSDFECCSHLAWRNYAMLILKEKGTRVGEAFMA